MTFNPKRIDAKNIVIVILLILVFAEGVLIFKWRPKKIAVIEKPKKAAFVKVKPKEKHILGRIAIITDDWGYNSELCEPLGEIKSPISVSILPNLKHSLDIVTCAQAAHKEIMLHLPMEPHEVFEKYPANYMIETSMNKRDIEKILNNALASVPLAVGVNNHTGSKATEDNRTMQIVLAFLKQKGLFFVDSLVTSNSVCREVARGVNIPFTQRDIFLDNKNERAYIEGQFAQLVERAKSRGYAVAIGHARHLTLQIIKEQMEQLAPQGYQFVTIRQLIESFH